MEVFSLSKEVIRAEKLGNSGSYLSHAIATDELVFSSGQTPRDPTTGEIVRGGIKAQTKLVLENLRSVLEAAGTSLGNAVKVTIFLTSMEDFSQMNEVYQSYFSGSPPARSCVEVSALADKEYKVEIELIASKR